MAYLTLSWAECLHIAYTCGVDELWPAAPHQQPEHPLAGGPDWRLRFIRAIRQQPRPRPADDDAWERQLERPFEFRLSTSELWLLDSLLLRQDPRASKLPDGRPVEELLMKVWDALIGVDEPEGTDDARHQNHDDHRAPADRAGDATELQP